jgi:DNA-binding protein H-NS
MTNFDFEDMPLDDLWSIYEKLRSILESKIEDEKRRLENRLDELGRKSGGVATDILQRRSYPKAEPKFRHPGDPSKTWSGRGKQPRWVIELLATGTKIGDLRIVEDAC